MYYHKNYIIIITITIITPFCLRGAFCLSENCFATLKIIMTFMKTYSLKFSWNATSLPPPNLKFQNYVD